MITNEQIIIRLIVSMILGSLIGIERERINWAAGLRTHMIVCLGSSLFMIVSAYGFGDVLTMQHATLDPSRIAAQVVSGIGFLGAGTILIRKNVILGLTTAASLWGVAAIGLAVGSGLYIAAITATTIMLLILAGIKPLERFIFARRGETMITIRSGTKITVIEKLQDELGKNLEWMKIETDKLTREFTIHAGLRKNISRNEAAKTLHRIKKWPEVKKAFKRSGPFLKK